MPALTLHLFKFKPGTDSKGFVRKIKCSGYEVVLASRPRHIVVRPKSLDASLLAEQRWDLLVLLQYPDNSPSSLPASLQQVVDSEYKVLVGVPSKLLASYRERDAKLKQGAPSAPIIGSLESAQGKSSSQNLEISPDLLVFMDELTSSGYNGPVTMLNLLQFYPDGQQGYHKYGQAFIPVAGKRGGSAKLVGGVVKPTASSTVDSRGDINRPAIDWWNEISIVHYPSIRHFCDMLADDDYQAINERYRLVALRDTFLLCTTEFDIEDASAKL